MIETIAFKTQARTVDHLGREQIADCPTAISELWKNAYDAYARSVSLHIFDDAEPVAAIFDDGHGMSYDEFVNRWLIIGTESKFDASVDDEADRDGLEKRPKQGQKGIGRLSSANLGPLLLLVSKRKGYSFVAALIDWRIFENPYLVLSDIEIPVTQFDKQEELFEILPSLFDRLTDNIWGNANNPEKTERLKVAWDAFDRSVLEADKKAGIPSELIGNTIINARFEAHHLEPWSVWSKESEHGTALFVSDIHYDLRVQLSSVDTDGAIDTIRERFHATLSAFTDPFVDPLSNEENSVEPEFSYEVRTWSDGVSKVIIENDRVALNRQVTDAMEHVLSGNIDEDGVFRGQVKAFGEWRKKGKEYKIYPPKDYSPPKGPKTRVGPVGLHVATYERDRINSTHTNEEHAGIDSLSEQHSGFLIFRNGLRVLPYGRVDNDFFEIEARRSKSAGREYWNARRMFGRLALSREINPNLRDKAGREGFIDNRSAKALKILVAHILQRVAYEYFGLASDLRGEVLPGIREKNLAERAEHERKELTKKNAKVFRSRLKKCLPNLSVLHERTQEKVAQLSIESIESLEEVQQFINDTSEELSNLRLTTAPAKLGSSEDNYRSYRTLYVETQDLVKQLTEARTEAIERLKPAKPEEIAERQMQSLAGRLQARLRNWRRSITAIQESEQHRVETLLSEKNKEFHGLAMPLVEQVKFGHLELDVALESMESTYLALDEGYENVFQSYLETLELVSQNINIELIASQGAVENAALRDDINTLNRVAQLGVTVEILGHELNSNERLIREGIKQLESTEKSPAVQLIKTGYEALSHQLEFLSPLKVSGTRTNRKITGNEILEYLVAFFDTPIRSRGITIEATEGFKAFQVKDQPSRLYPVFVNLLNNSIYWLVTSKTKEPKIELSFVDGNVFVSDNGPGIDPLDQESLFKMFFTRKVSGGRGIGLYLCRANLKAAGHSIEYVSERKMKRLSGANFIIKFKGAVQG